MGNFWKIINQPLCVVAITFVVALILFLIFAHTERVDCTLNYLPNKELFMEELNYSEEFADFIVGQYLLNFTQYLSFESQQEALAYRELLYDYFNKLQSEPHWFEPLFICDINKTALPVNFEDFIGMKSFS